MRGADPNWIGWDDLTPLDVADRTGASALGHLYGLMDPCMAGVLGHTANVFRSCFHLAAGGKRKRWKTLLVTGSWAHSSPV
jgi:hypothetical protein